MDAPIAGQEELADGQIRSDAMSPCTTELLYISMESTTGTGVACLIGLSGTFYFGWFVQVAMEQQNGSAVDIPVHPTPQTSFWGVEILSGFPLRHMYVSPAPRVTPS